MKEYRIGIEELKELSDEERVERIRERVIDMYCRVADLHGALLWMWKDLADRQGGF